MEYEQWKEILSSIDNEADLSKDNVIEKIKEKLKEKSEDEHKKWVEVDFNVNHLFHTVFKPDLLLEHEERECALLHLVAYGNLGKVAGALSKIKEIDVNALETLSLSTPLHIAAKFDSAEVIDALLEVGTINVNARNRVAQTPLHYAVLYKREKAIDALLKVKDIDVNLTNENSETPLHYAAQLGSKEAISALLEVKGINVNAKNKDSKTPLHLVAPWLFDKEALNILIKGGADVKAVDKNGNTLLHLVASHYCDEEVANALIENGADVNAVNKDGKTPRDLAKNDDIKELLKAAEEKQPEKLSKETDLPQDDKDTTRLLGKTESTSAATKGVFAGCVTAALSTAVAVALFATGMVAVELMPIMIAVAAVTIAALAVGGTTYMLSKPNTKVDETKGIQVNGDMSKVTS